MWELGTCEAGNDDGDGRPYLGDLNQEVGAGLQGKCPGEVSETESKTLVAGKQNVVFKWWTRQEELAFPYI